MAETTLSAVSLPPAEAIAFLRQKVNVTSTHWADLWNEAHARGFMVAGAASEALVADFRHEVARALEHGTTLADFRKAFDRIVEKHGWSHTGTPGWRAQIIYETNLSTAYSAGRYAQMTEPATLAVFPYWQYQHNSSAHPRPQHVAWDGLTLRADDPWWGSHYPPNGWHCHCSVRPITERGLGRLKKDGPDTAPPLDLRDWTNPKTGEVLKVPHGIDPGFGYNPGAAWKSGEGRLPPRPPPPEPPPASKPPGAHPAQPDRPPPAEVSKPAVPVEPPPAEVSRPPEPAPAEPVKPAPVDARDPQVLRPFLKHPQGTAVVGDIPPAVQKVLEAEQAEVLLSDQTMEKQMVHHPDLTEADYLAIPELLSHPSAVVSARERHMLFFKVGSRIMVGVVKVTKNAAENYLVSLFLPNPRWVRNAIRNGKLISGSTKGLGEV